MLAPASLCTRVLTHDLEKIYALRTRSASLQMSVFIGARGSMYICSSAPRPSNIYGSKHIRHGQGGPKPRLPQIFTPALSAHTVTRPPIVRGSSTIDRRCIYRGSQFIFYISTVPNSECQIQIQLSATTIQYQYNCPAHAWAAGPEASSSRT